MLIYLMTDILGYNNVNATRNKVDRIDADIII